MGVFECFDVCGELVLVFGDGCLGVGEFLGERVDDVVFFFEGLGQFCDFCFVVNFCFVVIFDRFGLVVELVLKVGDGGLGVSEVVGEAVDGGAVVGVFLLEGGEGVLGVGEGGGEFVAESVCFLCGVGDEFAGIVKGGLVVVLGGVEGGECLVFFEEFCGELVQSGAAAGEFVVFVLDEVEAVGEFGGGCFDVVVALAKLEFKVFEGVAEVVGFVCLCFEVVEDLGEFLVGLLEGLLWVLQGLVVLVIFRERCDCCGLGYGKCGGCLGDALGQGGVFSQEVAVLQVRCGVEVEKSHGAVGFADFQGVGG